MLYKANICKWNDEENQYEILQRLDSLEESLVIEAIGLENTRNLTTESNELWYIFDDPDTYICIWVDN